MKQILLRIGLFSGFIIAGLSVQSVSAQSQLQWMINRAFEKSSELKISQKEVEKARIDRSRAFSAYLPKVNAEASYTYMNAPIEFPDDLQTLLTKTQALLVKETAAMATYSLPVGTPGKVDFSTPYQVTMPDGSVVQTPLGSLVSENVQGIPPIQD